MAEKILPIVIVVISTGALAVADPSCRILLLKPSAAPHDSGAPELAVTVSALSVAAKPPLPFQ